MTNDQEWAEGLAKKYDISPETVLGIHKTMRNKVDDRVYVGGRHLRRRERTETFLELYFEGRNEQ